MKLSEMIAVIEAFDRGEKIEYLHVSGWLEARTPIWDFSKYEYRIAPKPREKVVLYQWLCLWNGDYFTTYHRGDTPNGAGVIRRLDETRMEVEI